MMELLVPAVIIGVGFGAIAGAVWLFLRTPRADRFRFPRLMRIEEALVRYPASMGARIIPARRKEAFLRACPYLALVAVMLLFSVWLRVAEAPHCIRIWGLNVMVSGLLALFAASVVIVLFVMLSIFAEGIKVLRGGYFPPLDSVFFMPRIAIGGWQAKVFGVLHVVIPLVAICVFYVLWRKIVLDMSWDGILELVRRFEEKCVAP